jgi:hypothetical protein
LATLTEHEDDHSLYTYSASLEIIWNPISFLIDQQYQGGEDHAIRTVITLTGSGIDAQAITCAQYMQQTWPMTGIETLQALEAAISDSRAHSHKCIEDQVHHST